MGKKKLIILGCIIGVLLLGGLIAKPILKGVLKGTAGDIIAPEMTQVDPDSLTPADFGNIVGEQFVTAYKNWLKEGWQTETDTSIRYTFETDCVPIWRELASQEMTEENCFEVLASQYLLGVGYFYKYNISQAAVEAKNALALAKKFTEWNKGDTETVSLAEKLVADIEGGKIATIKGLITALKSAGAMYSLPKEDQEAFFSGLYKEPGEKAATGIWSIGEVAKINDGSIWDEKIARLQGIVAGDYDYEQQAQAQFKIAGYTRMKMAGGNVTLDEVVAEYQKVIDNFPQSEYSAEASKEIANLYATHSTIEHKLKAIEYYQLYLQKIDPFSPEVEETLETIKQLEIEILTEQGKVVEGLAMPEFVRYDASVFLISLERGKALATLKGTSLALKRVDDMKLEDAVSYLNNLKEQVTGEVAKARIDVKKAQVYEKENKIAEALTLYMNIKDEYGANAPTQTDFADKRITFFNSQMAGTAMLSGFTADYVALLNYNKALLQLKGTEPAKFHYEMGQRLETAKDYANAVKEYRIVCQKFAGTEEAKKADESLRKIYTAIGRPDQYTAFKKSLEGTK